MTQGEILKAFRERMNLSQEVVAAYLEVKREMLSYYENNNREIPFTVLEKLTKLFGVALADFFETDLNQIRTNIDFAFRAEGITENDLLHIAQFRKVVKNYYKIRQLTNENGE
jgi:transcriptional regulator with XRE-family HTH domain